MDFAGVIQEAAAAALDSPYQHPGVMSMRDFERYLADRDCKMSLDEIWKIGILRPAVVDGPIPEPLLHEGMTDAGGAAQARVHYADARPMKRSLRAAQTGTAGTFADLGRQAWYHPFQVWQAYEVRRRLRIVMPSVMMALRPARSYHAVAGHVRQGIRDSVEGLTRSWDLVDSTRLLTFLINVGPLMLPSISGVVTSERARGESYEGYWSFRRAHDAGDFMATGGFTERDVRRWHRDVSIAVYGLDPLSRWFDLARNISWKSWESIRGVPRLAHELYTVAEIVRGYAGEFLGIELPEEDEVWHGPVARKVKERDYGFPIVTLRRREIRRRVAREYGLDGGLRLVWVVEGDTEVGFIEQYSRLRGLSLDARGMEVWNLEGDGELKKPAVRQRLQEAWREDQFSYVTVDFSGAAKKALRRWAEGVNQKEERLVTAGFKIWNGDFESDNFTDHELAAVVMAVAAEDGQSVSITGEGIARNRKPGVSTEQAIRPCLKGQRYPWKKDRGWGARLADWASDHPCPTEIAVDGDRPIVALFERLFRGCVADFLGSIEAYRVDGDKGELIAVK